MAIPPVLSLSIQDELSDIQARSIQESEKVDIKIELKTDLKSKDEQIALLRMMNQDNIKRIEDLYSIIETLMRWPA